MGKIVAVGAVSLIVFIISAIVAWLILRADTARLREERGVPPVPTMMGKDEVGIVDQVVFDTDERLQEWRAAKRKRLSTFGWSNRGKNLIHIPISKAMDEVISQAAAARP